MVKTNNTFTDNFVHMLSRKWKKTSKWFYSISTLHPFGVAKLSTSFGWGKGGNVTAAGWQVTLSDHTWYVISSSGEVKFTNCLYLSLPLSFTYRLSAWCEKKVASTNEHCYWHSANSSYPRATKMIILGLRKTRLKSWVEILKNSLSLTF